jgi:flagellar basal-body rod protein FlgB
MEEWNLGTKLADYAADKKSAGILRRGNRMADLHGIFGGTLFTVEKALDLRSVKHNLLVSNITNMETPNYKAFDFEVEKELKKAVAREEAGELKRTHAAHIPIRGKGGGAVEMTRRTGSSLGRRADGNTVDMEREMASLAENTLLYNSLARVMAKKLQGLKNAIRSE